MFSKQIVLALLVAYAEARFGQEQVPISAISAVQGGDPGAAATIAGAAISDLLGAADPCAKLATADKIVAELGGGADAIAAAIGMVTAEKNTNPFANGNVQQVCGDPTLPATAELRGITPLIDPAVDVDGAVAALSAQTAANPLNADGLSVFDLLNDNGLGDLVANSEGGAAGGNAGNANAGNANAGNANNNNQGNQGNANNNNNQGNQGNQGNANNNQNQGNQGNANAGAQDEDCEEEVANGNQGGNQNQNQGGNQNQNQGGNQNQNQGGNQNAGNATENAGGNAGGNTGAGGADFGLCTPTIIFEGGLGGRPATEFTFQIADELARGGQQEALNPDIITNALCNQLTNVCEANAAAVALCEDAKAQVQGGTRNKALADQFNSLVGFAGAVTNPSGGPADVGAAAKRRVMRSRVFRA